MNRELTIYTWGKLYRKWKPTESEKNYSVEMISIRDYNMNLKRINGKSNELQNKIILDQKFINVINSIVKLIEDNDYKVISISCEHGRHRSVAIAEILKKLYYPQASIQHLDL